MTTRIGDRLDRVKATRIPKHVCTWCMHQRSMHDEGRGCMIDECRCRRFSTLPGSEQR